MGIWTIERPWLVGPFSNGSGDSVAIGVLVVLFVLGIIMSRPTLSILRSPTFARWAYRGLGLMMMICCACDLLALIRTFDYMAIVSDNVNEVDDVLGPAAGMPQLAFIPQYTALDGWLFVPVASAVTRCVRRLDRDLLLTLDVVCMLLAVWITRRSLGIRAYILAIAFEVPMTFVTSGAGSVGSIASLFQEVPIRLVSGLTIAALGLNRLVLLSRDSPGQIRAVHGCHMRAGRVELPGLRTCGRRRVRLDDSSGCDEQRSMAGSRVWVAECSWASSLIRCSTLPSVPH